MNYYIQGNKEKAEQIKAAFEKAGIDTGSYDFSHKDVLFFTFEAKGKTYMMSSLLGTGLDNIILTHPDYQELELPVEPKFKVGDWVVRKDGTTFYGGNYAEQVTSVIDKQIDLSSGTWLPSCAIRLWTIADAKDGDVLATDNIICIFRKLDKDGYYIISPCVYTVKGGLEIISDENDTIGSCGFKPATKEYRDLLFAKIKEAGYQWDAEKKELRKIQPHYDISNFHAGMPVLVRADNNCRWDYSVFSRITGNEDWPFAVCNGVSFTQCIPFEGNEHLLGTTDMPSEEFINW